MENARFVRVGQYLLNVGAIEIVVVHPNGSATVQLASGRMIDFDDNDTPKLLSHLGVDPARTIASAGEHWRRMEEAEDWGEPW